MRGRSKSIKGVIRVWFVGVCRVGKFYSLWVGTHLSLKFWVM
jgi:CRISPR/Cas system CMR-associated protein Cmr1 (group 7 of RAMP superfamily)